MTVLQWLFSTCCPQKSLRLETKVLNHSRLPSINIIPQCLPSFFGLLGVYASGRISDECLTTKYIICPPKQLF